MVLFADDTGATATGWVAAAVLLLGIVFKFVLDYHTQKTAKEVKAKADNAENWEKYALHLERLARDNEEIMRGQAVELSDCCEERAQFRIICGYLRSANENMRQAIIKMGGDPGPEMPEFIFDDLHTDSEKKVREMRHKEELLSQSGQIPAKPPSVVNP